ncbi:hypothetical protein [Pedobacter sp. NJ-S-72]
MKKKEIVSNELFLEFKNEYLILLNSERRALQNHSRNDILLNGLFMASQSLLNSTIKYHEADISEFNKKHFKIEKSILKYLSRTAAKTSPFSTLTSLSIAALNNRNLESPFIKVKCKGNREPISVFRVNNSIQQLFKRLLLTDLTIIGNFNITLNSTCRYNEGSLSFLINRNNVESFQVVQTDDVIDLLISFFKNENSIKFECLIEKMRNFIDSDINLLGRYLSDCISSGLLEVELGVSGIDPDWILSMSNYLCENFKDNASESIEQMIKTLLLLDKSILHYGKKNFQQRSEILSIIQKQISQTITSFNDHKTNNEQLKDDTFHEIDVSDPTKLGNVFYEDSKAQINIEISKDNLFRAGEKLFEFSQNLDILDLNNHKKASFFEFFDKKYIGVDRISIIDFYEDYYREKKKKNLR